MTVLSGVAGEIEEIIGLDLALKLLKAKGGQTIQIPVRAQGTELARIIGCEACERLAKDYGAGRLPLPMAAQKGSERDRRERREKAERMLRDGASIAEVARACELHERTVQNYRARLDDRQGELPL